MTRTVTCGYSRFFKQPTTRTTKEERRLAQEREAREHAARRAEHEAWRRAVREAKEKARLRVFREAGLNEEEMTSALELLEFPWICWEYCEERNRLYGGRGPKTPNPDSGLAQARVDLETRVVSQREGGNGWVAGYWVEKGRV